MSSQGPAGGKTMTGLICQENFACSGNEEAAFECDECKTLQCERCEEVLHKQERLQNHERTRIAPGYVPYCSSCKGANNGSATGARPRAAVRCLSCKVDLCADCQKRTHSGGNKRKHQVTFYQPIKNPEPQEGPKEDDEIQKKKMTEKVVSFLLVDEAEQIQVFISCCLCNKNIFYNPLYRLRSLTRVPVPSRANGIISLGQISTSMGNFIASQVTC